MKIRSPEEMAKKYSSWKAYLESARAPMKNNKFKALKLLGKEMLLDLPLIIVFVVLFLCFAKIAKYDRNMYIQHKVEFRN